MKPKVSVLISAYFAEKYIQGRIENLLLQEGVDFEIVVVCQKDSPEFKIVVPYTVKQPHDFVVVTTDGVPTVYEVWNIAIANSSGEYLTNANSDDRLYPGALAKLERALDQHRNAGVVYSNIDRTQNLEGKPFGKFEFMEGGLKELYWKGCFIGPMPMWRKSLHDQFGEFDGEYTSAGDYEFWLRVAAGHIGFYKIPETLGLHLERPDGLEHKSPVRSTWEAARAKFKYRTIMEPARDIQHG